MFTINDIILAKNLEFNIHDSSSGISIIKFRHTIDRNTYTFRYDGNNYYYQDKVIDYPKWTNQLLKYCHFANAEIYSVQTI